MKLSMCALVNSIRAVFIVVAVLLLTSCSDKRVPPSDAQITEAIRWAATISGYDSLCSGAGGELIDIEIRRVEHKYQLKTALFRAWKGGWYYSVDARTKGSCPGSKREEDRDAKGGYTIKNVRNPFDRVDNYALYFDEILGWTAARRDMISYSALPGIPGQN